MRGGFWHARQQRQHPRDQAVGMPFAQKLHFSDGAISGSCHGSFLQGVLPKLFVGGLTELPASTVKTISAWTEVCPSRSTMTADCMRCDGLVWHV